MVTIEARIVINKSPEKICDFILGLDKEKYTEWHICHKDFKAIKRTQNIIGSVLYFEEVVAGIRLHYNWTIQEYVENSMILLRAKYFVPIKILLQFTHIEHNNTEVFQRITIGFDNFFGKITDMVVESGYINLKQKRELERHFCEEFKNLEGMI